MERTLRRAAITIIVPVHNAARWLEECLDSLCDQTFGYIEIICVDDGSTDDSARILADRARRDSRIVVLSQNNRGVSASRNRAIDTARGEWLMFVDADDHIDPDTCRAALTVACELRADVVMWPYVREWADGRQAVRRLVDGDRVFRGSEARLIHRRIVGLLDDELRDPTQLHSWGTVWGKLYSRHVVGDTRFTDTAVVGSAEDALFNIDIFSRVDSVYYLDRPMYHYRKNASTFTGSYNPALRGGWARLHAMMAELIETRELGPDFSRALDARIALGLIGKGINEWRSGQSFFLRLGALREIIREDNFRRALRTLPLGRFPLHWRLFFGAARLGWALPVAICINLIGKIG